MIIHSSWQLHLKYRDLNRLCTGVYYSGAQENNIKFGVMASFHESIDSCFLSVFHICSNQCVL